MRLGNRGLFAPRSACATRAPSTYNLEDTPIVDRGHKCGAVRGENRSRVKSGVHAVGAGGRCPEAEGERVAHLAQGKVSLERILRIGDDACRSSLLEIAGTHRNQERELALFHQRVIKPKLLLPRKKPMTRLELRAGDRPDDRRLKAG